MCHCGHTHKPITRSMCVVGNTNTAVYYLTVYNYRRKLENRDLFEDTIARGLRGRGQGQGQIISDQGHVGL